MKKVFFLMLFLTIVGTASVDAQVRIGGSDVSNEAAVLDLNATDGTDNGTKTLALPRVNLSSTTDKLSNATLLNGMLVYNTNTTVGAGVYYWDGTQWVKPSGSTSITLSGTEFRRAALTGDVTAAENSNNVTINDGAVTSAKIADGAVETADLANGAVTAAKLNNMAATTDDVLSFNGTNWAPTAIASSVYGKLGNGNYVKLEWNGTSGFIWNLDPNYIWRCVACFPNDTKQNFHCQLYGNAIKISNAIGESAWAPAAGSACIFQTFER